MQSNLKFSVVTPTFNRAGYLERVFESLVSQTLIDFEWVVVNDGSTDNTKSAVDGLIERQLITIKYIEQANQGKRRAIAAALQAASFEMTVILDDDDYLIESALEHLASSWQTIPASEVSKFSGVTARSVNEAGELFGPRLPRSPIDATYQEFRYIHGYAYEGFGCIRTAVLQEVLGSPQPGYLPDGLDWAAIGRRYQTRFVDTGVRVFVQQNSNRVSNMPPFAIARGMLAWHLDVLKNDFDYFRFAPIEFFRSSVHLTRFSLLAGKFPFATLPQLGCKTSRALVVALSPISFLLVSKDMLEWMGYWFKATLWRSKLRLLIPSKFGGVSLGIEGMAKTGQRKV